MVLLVVLVFRKQFDWSTRGNFLAHRNTESSCFLTRSSLSIVGKQVVHFRDEKRQTSLNKLTETRQFCSLNFSLL